MIRNVWLPLFGFAATLWITVFAFMWLDHLTRVWGWQ